MNSNIIFPNALKAGSKIAIISPAGAVEENQLSSNIKIIEDQGYEVVLGKHLYNQFNFGYSYAGTETERISELQWALNEPSISGIWASRGGYGCQHLIQHLKISKFRNHPKWYIGYSDNTVIQSYLLRKGFTSIHGQTVKTSTFGLSPESYAGIFNLLKGQMPKYVLPSSHQNHMGKAEGTLVGGNLALIYSLMGTPFGFKFKNNILFIEEIGEQFYALDRMLMSLELAGIFKQIRGMIVGGMTNMGKEHSNPQYQAPYDNFAYEIIAQRVSQYDFPIIFGFPNGHIYDNQPLIIGAKTIIEANIQHATVEQLR